MRVFNSFEISGSGLTAQRLRMDVVANNIANVNTTRTAEGGPYKRQRVVFEPRREENQFLLPLAGEAKRKQMTTQGVRVVAVSSDPAPARKVYDPGHPDANAQGYVEMPNVDPVTEMVDLMAATRAYEANVAAINATKRVLEAALSIGR